MAIEVRTNAAAVRGIITVKSGIDLGPYIEAAAMIVTARCAPLGYSDDELEMIERYVAAHFYEVNNPRKKRQWIGRTGQEIVSANALAFDLTHPGQQVRLFDYKGGLVGLEGQRKKIKMLWLGTKPEKRNYRRLWPWRW